MKHPTPTTATGKRATRHAMNGGVKPNGADAPATPPAKKPMRLTEHSEVMRVARAMLAGNQRAVLTMNPFKAAKPMPGVLPKGTKLAMDSALTASGQWAEGAWAQSAIAQGVVGSAFLEGQEFLGYPYLAVLAQRPEYRAIVETLATESMRKGFKIQAAVKTGDDKETDPDNDNEPGANDEADESDSEKQDKIAQLTDALDKLRVRDLMKTMSAQDGYLGRAHLYVDTGDTDKREELKTPIGNGRDGISRMKIKKGMDLFLRPIEAVWCYPNTYNSSNPLKPDWYQPQTWFVMGTEVHATRLLKFEAHPVPDLLKPAYSFGGLSMTQQAKPYVDNWLKVRQAIADIVQAFSVMVLSTDMSATLTADGDQTAMLRAILFNALRQNNGLMMVNKDTEEFNNVAAPLGTLDQLQAQALEHLCSVSKTPSVKLLGIQPAGLNADSEGIMRAYYDTIAAYQEWFYRPHLTTIVDFVQLALWGEVDDALRIVFEPLWTLDEKGQAEVRKIEAETDVILVDGGVLHPDEPRKRIASDPDTPYQGLDANDVPEPPAMPGMEGEGGGTAEEGGGELEPTKVKSSINVAGGDGLTADEARARAEAIELIALIDAVDGV